MSRGTGVYVCKQGDGCVSRGTGACEQGTGVCEQGDGCVRGLSGVL